MSDGRGARSTSAGAGARAAAARAVARVVREHVSIDEALPDAGTLSERDAPLVMALAFGACRWHHRLAWQTAQLLSKPLGARDVELGALLRVGLLQLQSMRVPDHAAVSATVEAAALIGARHAKGLVNAVLRRYLRERERLDTTMQRHREALYSHPQWLIDALTTDWPDEWTSILEANNAAPPMWLRVNLGRSTRDQYRARLAAEGVDARAPAESPAALLLPEPRPMQGLPGYDDGDVSVQDIAAQRAAGLLALAPGQRVLDACAAPGGKTAHMLESCPGLEEVWALDRDATRLDSVRASLTRLGLAATLVHADATRPEEWWDGRPFDRVLIDAPCSALGVIRRHPDIKLLRSPADIDRAVDTQARLLAALWPLLAPGGRLVYATCTVLHRENGGQVESFVADRGDAQLSLDHPALQLKPGEANGDGFYYACIDKQETLSPFRVPNPSP